MLKKCETLLAGLKEQLALARQIQNESRTHNLDVMFIEQAIQVVSLRIGYLKNLAADKAKTKPPGEPAAGENQE